MRSDARKFNHAVQFFGGIDCFLNDRLAHLSVPQCRLKKWHELARAWTPTGGVIRNARPFVFVGGCLG